MADRRLFLTLLFLGLCAPGQLALAKDGDGGKGNSGSGGGKGDDGKDDGDKEDDDKDDDDEDGREKDDDERIREAVARGDAEPLKDILKALRRRYKGEVVNIRLSGEGPDLQYRIRIIDPNDRLIEVRVNARTARIIGSR